MTDTGGLLASRYRLDQPIGEGAMGTVLRAHDERLDRTVAVKLLRPAYASEPALVARFYGEARAAAAIRDPHVVSVFDVLDDGGTHAIVMEYIDGPSLATVLRREGKLSETRAVRYARDAARGLAAAHARGLLHRDVKPANLLIATGDTLLVTDFGMAKAMTNDVAITETGRLVGSAAYVSPEQAQDLPLSAASDLYSLGVVLYEMLTGWLPFAATSAVQMAVAHVSQPAPSITALARVMSPRLATIVHTLLRKDPAERYPSAEALLRALDGVAAQPVPIVARTVPPPPPPRARRVPAAVLPFAALFVLAAGVEMALAARSHAAAPAAAPPRVAVVHPTIRPRPRPALVTIPDLSGLPFTAAMRAMHGLPLHTAFAARVADADANTVIEQHPAAGTRVPRGSAAFVVISTGPQPRIAPVPVPDHHRGDGDDGGDRGDRGDGGD